MKICSKIFALILVVVSVFSAQGGKLLASVELQEFEYVVSPGSSANEANKKCLIRDGYIHKNYSSASGLNWSRVETFFSNFKDKSELFYSFVNSNFIQRDGGPLSTSQTEIFFVFNEGEITKKKLLFAEGPKSGSIQDPKLLEVVSLVKSLCTF